MKILEIKLIKNKYDVNILYHLENMQLKAKEFKCIIWASHVSLYQMPKLYAINLFLINFSGIPCI